MIDQKHKLNILLVIASVGVMLDGVTTTIGVAMEIPSGNPIVQLIGLEGSLIFRAIAIICLYIIVKRAYTIKDIRRLELIFYVLIFFMWLILILNGAGLLLIALVF